MTEGIYELTAGALTQRMRLEVLANNLANVNSVGFKEDRVSFTVSNPASNPEGSIGGIESASLVPSENEISLTGLPFVTYTDFSPGQLQYTGNALDLAIEGKGFFSVETPQGVQYTRKGDFSLNEEGVLVTSEGHPVLGEGGEIRTDRQTLEVDVDGNISADGSTLDTLKMVYFSDLQRLEKVGDTMFAPADSNVSEIVAEGVSVRQGFIEHSNVDPLRVMTEMIEALRGFESYQKVIRAMDEVTSETIREVGTLA